MSIVYADRASLDDFDPIDLTFIDNTICYLDKYLAVVTGRCIVLHATQTEVWLVADDNLQRIIRGIDVQFIQHSSRDNAAYLKLAETTFPSLKLSPAGNYNLLKIRIHSNTEMYGSCMHGKCARSVLSAHYNSNQIYWRALKILCEPTEEDDDKEQEFDFLQECQLEQKLIKI